MLMQSWWTPIQQHMQAKDAWQGMQRMQAAQNAPYGSLAQQWNPANYGSLQRQWMPQYFGPDNVDNTLAGMQRRRSMPQYL